MIVRWWCLLLALVLLVPPVLAEEPAAQSKPAKSSSATEPKKVEDEYELQRMLVDTLDQVERNYVKGISRRELIEAAIEGVLRKLDPYSSYIAPEELDRFRGNIESEFGGIGIQITMNRAQQLTVLSPLVDSPAYRAGILSGDQIIEIDGKSTEDIDLDTATKWLKGKTGSKVELTVIHPGRSKPEKIDITRDRIHVATILGDRRKENDAWDFMYDEDKGIGYIRVTVFSRSTPDELRKAIKSLKKRNFSGLILDLRFNSGGLLSSAIEVSDMFLEKGRIVSTKGRNVPERVWDAHENNTFSGFRMVVLVNRFSASASEIVSACLQDHGRAVVMGERTWGKGSVQNVIPLEHGHSALKLTTASYHRPSGKNIHRFPDASDDDDWGVKPDEGFAVKLSPADMVALLVRRRHRDVIQPHPKVESETDKSSDKKTDDEKEPKPEKTAKKRSPTHKADQVLRMAIEYLSSEMVKAN